MADIIPFTGQGGDLRQVPHSVAAEAGVLGSILRDSRAYDAVVGFLRTEHFASPLHARIYAVICSLVDRGEPADPVTVHPYLAADELLDQAGGMKYLARLVASLVTHSNVGAYGRVVYDAWVRRRTLEILSEGMERAYAADAETAAEAEVDMVEQQLFELAAFGSRVDSLRTAGAAATSAVAQIMAAYHRGGGTTGTPTCLRDLDGKLAGLHPSDLIILAGRPSMGKDLALDAKLLRADGTFMRMGDAQIGDKLASVDGAPSSITGVYPQGEKQLYWVTLSDGRRVEAGAEHLWRVHCRKWADSPRILSTAQVAEKLSRVRYRRRMSIDLINGEFGGGAPLPVHPWVLGALIANGGLTQRTPKITVPDVETVERLKSHLGSGYSYRFDGKFSYLLGTVRGARNPLTEALKSLGLMGLKSEHKFVPELYFSASREDRISLLCGLLDGDGWIEKFGAICYGTSSDLLARDVQRLVRSVGGICTLYRRFPSYTYKGASLDGLPAWRCNIRLPDRAELFCLGRKKARAGVRRFHPLTFVDVSPSRVTESQCISVDHPSALYVSDDYTVTHNTALATVIAYNAARYFRDTDRAEDQGKQVAFFSLEMSAEQLMGRLISYLANIDHHKLRNGYLTPDEVGAIARAEAEIATLPLHIDDQPATSASAIRVRCRRLARRSKKAVGLCVVDYLQLMAPPAKTTREQNRVQEVSAITGGLKACAKSLKIPVLALSQLSRALESREDKRPQLSDLRESGTIEQDADVVMFVYRDEYYLQRAEPKNRADETDARHGERLARWQAMCEAAANKAEVIIGKQRHGPIGTVELYFDAKRTWFEDLETRQDAYAPKGAPAGPAPPPHVQEPEQMGMDLGANYER